MIHVFFLLSCFGSPGLVPAVHVDQRIGAACESCHATIVASYRASAMAHALSVPSRTELGKDEALLDTANGCRYRLHADEGGAALAETWTSSDPSGESSAHGREYPLLLAIGAGRRATSFAVKRGSFLWQSPLTLVREDGVLAPELGVDPRVAPGARALVPLGADCLRCHTDAALIDAYPTNLDQLAKPPISGLSCSACHARADEHASSVGGDLDPYARHSAPSPIESVAACARCHLQGESEVLLHGERAVFVPLEPSAEVGFVSQAERLALVEVAVDKKRRSPGAFMVSSLHEAESSILLYQKEPHSSTPYQEVSTGCNPGGRSSETKVSGPAAKRVVTPSLDPELKEGPNILISTLRLHFALFGVLIGAQGVLWADVLSTLQISEGLFGTAQAILPLVAVALLLQGGASGTFPATLRPASEAVSFHAVRPRLRKSVCPVK